MLNFLNVLLKAPMTVFASDFPLNLVTELAGV